MSDYKTSAKPPKIQDHVWKQHLEWAKVVNSEAEENSRRQQRLREKADIAKRGK